MCKDLMPIGQFSKSCRLSIKALRHYGKEGLLEPAYIDPTTGYRYYATAQARDAVRIAMLRSLDVPLPRIRKMLQAEGKALQAMLEAEHQRVALSIQKQTQALASLRRLAREADLAPYRIDVRVEPNRTLARLSCETSLACMVQESGDLVYALFSELEQLGCPYESPVMCINEDPGEDGRVIVHACAGVPQPHPTLNQATFVEVPGGQVAWLVHRGAYEELGVAYHALCAWAQERGYEQRDALREIYLNDPAEVPPDDLETEVLLPIRQRS